jgi:hypothetical protein
MAGEWGRVRQVSLMALAYLYVQATKSMLARVKVSELDQRFPSESAFQPAVASRSESGSLLALE